MRNAEAVRMIFPERASAKTLTAMIMFVALVACAAYGNTLFNGFVFDDEYQVLKNPWIRDFRHLPTIFSSEVWAFKGDAVSNYYRPLLHVTYMITYNLFGYSEYGFHAVNVLLHAAVSALVFLLVHTILSRQGVRYATAASLAAALIFAVHPIHTEVVAPIMSLTDLLLTLFYVAVIWLHIKFVGRAWYLSMLTAVLFACALLSKETAITLPAVLLSYDYFIEKRVSPLSALLVRYVPYVIVAAAYLAVRSAVLGSFAPIDRHPDLSRLQCILNIFPLAIQYGYKLLVPLHLNAMYEFHPLRSITEPRALLSILIFVVALALFVWWARHSTTIAFGLVLTLLPLLPAFYIRAIPYPFAERYLYLPSVGFVLILAEFVARSFASPRMARTLPLVIAALVCLYAIGTIQRNTVWKDNFTLWSDTLTKSPNDAIAHCNLGYALKKRGRIREAIVHFSIATQINPHSDFFRSLGNAYYEAGNWQDAVKNYEMAVSLGPLNDMAHNDLGALYGELGALNKAIEHFETAVRLKPGIADYHYNLGIVYRDSGMMNKALEQLEMAVRLNPVESQYRTALKETYRLRNR